MGLSRSYYRRRPLVGHKARLSGVPLPWSCPRLCAREVAKQLEASRSPDSIMRQPSADRGEKRVIHGDDHEYEEAA